MHRNAPIKPAPVAAPRRRRERRVLCAGLHRTEFGFCGAGLVDGRLARLQFFPEAGDEAGSAIRLNEDSDDSARSVQLARLIRWPAGSLVLAPEQTEPVVRKVLAARPEDLAGWPLHLEGTPFQRTVWEALRTIPPGHTLTYGELAAQIGRDGAGRAVGQAVGANPIALVVPCHRVRPKFGGLGGFRWGTALKAAFLNREGVQLA